MKILYSFPHPADRLDNERAGHTVRANALLRNLEALGHDIVRIEAASGRGIGSASVSAYRKLVKRLVPKLVARKLRDLGRIRFGRAYGKRLAAVAAAERPDVILETHIAFSLGGAIAAREAGVPLALDDVAPWWEELEYGAGLERAARSIHRQQMSAASLVVAVNDTLREVLAAGGVPEQKIAVIPNGVRSTFLSAPDRNAALRKALAIPAEAVVIIFVGSFQAYHSVDLLIEAFRNLHAKDRPVHLLLVGGDPEEAGDLARRSDVTLTGWIPHDQIVDYLSLGDIAVMPATNTYGNPMKLYEYLAMGMPVVAPDLPTIKEVVRAEVDALLFEDGSVPSLVATLQRLVDDDGLRASLGAAGRAEAPDHQWRRRAETLAMHLEKLVARHRDAAGPRATD